MTFPNFFILFLEQVFLVFNQMLSIGSFGRHVLGKIKTSDQNLNYCIVLSVDRRGYVLEFLMGLPFQ